jgi:inosine-uridine nucleoside N-ribohydrolase
MGNRGFSPLYDPVAIAVAVDMRLVDVKEYYAEVVTMVPDDAFNRGQTVVDKRAPWRVQKKPNIKVCTNINGKRFIDFYVGRLSSAQ